MQAVRNEAFRIADLFIFVFQKQDACAKPAVVACFGSDAKIFKVQRIVVRQDFQVFWKIKSKLSVPIQFLKQLVNLLCRERCAFFRQNGQQMNQFGRQMRKEDMVFFVHLACVSRIKTDVFHIVHLLQIGIGFEVERRKIR